MKRKQAPTLPRSPDEHAEAARILDEWFADHDFFIRQGTPPNIAAAGIREKILDLLTESEDVRELRNRIDDLETEMRLSDTRIDELKDDLSAVEQDLYKAQERADKLQKELDACRGQ